MKGSLSVLVCFLMFSMFAWELIDKKYCLIVIADVDFGGLIACFVIYEIL